MRAINLFSAFVFLGCAVAAQSAASTDCFTSPALPACATFTLNDTQLQADLQSICPTMGGSVTGWPSACTLYQTCNQGLGATAPCSPLVLIRSACAEQPDLPACSKYAVLCGAGSMVPQCKNETAIANLPTANDTQQAVFSMCQSMPGMNGCDHCSPTAPAGMAMAQSLQVQCPNPLMSLSALCLSSPMGGCSIWTSFCNATMTAGGAAGFPSLCSAAPMGPTMAPGPQMDMMSGPGGANGDGGSHGQVSGSMMDGGMGGPSPCETDPTQPSCAGYEMPDSEASADIMNMCQEMPNMVGCSLWSECESGGANGMWCKPFSVLATVCNEMGSMSGCNGYNGMCQTPGSVIQACTAQGPIPNSLSTDDATSAVIAMCSTHSMVGCQNCTSPSQCPHPMNTLSQVCLEMPGMSGCDAFYNFCHATDNTFKQLCGEGPPQGLPPMKMWLHASIRDILLIKSWVPENGGAYAASCIAVIAAAVLVQALKAWRVMLEVRWVQRRQAECCSPSCNAKAVDGAMAGHSMSAPLGSDSDLEAPVSGLSQRASTKRLPQFVPHKDQWSRNAVRAVFTGIIVFFDYMLMLIVMSFNIGIILSAVAGFALGALLFGHMGERAGGATVVAVGDVAPDSENDLEVHFVEPQSCCNTRNV